MSLNITKQPPKCENCNSLMHPEFDGKKTTYSCPYECLWIQEYSGNFSYEMNDEDLEFFARIEMPFRVMDDISVLAA